MLFDIFRVVVAAVDNNVYRVLISFLYGSSRYHVVFTKTMFEIITTLELNQYGIGLAFPSLNKSHSENGKYTVHTTRMEMDSNIACFSLVIF